MENIYHQDESGFDEYFTRRYGYGLNSNKVNTQLSGRKYERQSCMSILNSNNLLVEPMIYQDTANSNTVYAYFEVVLPKLRPNSAIIMDNARFHKSKELQALFQQYNCLLVFLPPYSPDLNPIENMWGTIKQYLRNYYDYTLGLYENLSLAVCNHCQ